MSPQFRQLGRFCGIGLICFALGLAVLAGLGEYAGANYLIAYATSFIASNLAGYLLNARFTFEVRTDNAGAVRYMVVNLALLCVNTALMKLLVDVLGMWYITAAIVLAFFNAPIGYLAQRFFTYRVEIRSRPARL